MKSTISQAQAVFRRHAGMLRTSQAIAAGIHPRTLYALRDTGEIETLGRGLYRLANMPTLSQPDLVVVASKIPAGVICLISALSLHEITTQVPHEVFLALPKGAKRPQLDHPPVTPVWFSHQAYIEGIETRKIDGITVRVYGVSKTLADCFKFRNRIGLDVCIEALKLARQRRKLDVEALLHFARICRVERVIRPYVEAIL